MALTQVPPALLTSTTGTGTTVVLSASPTFTGTVTTPSITFSDGSTQTAAASPYVLKNRIINGAMVVDQRNNGAVFTPTDGSYGLDRWKNAVSAASKMTVQQVSTAPTGFNNSIKITSTSAYSLVSNSYFHTSQGFEGFNMADLGWGTANAQTVTISFRVYSSLTGTFGGAIQNYDATRSYPFTYTIPVANTWTTISITITGDTGGTWVGATNAGWGYLIFGLGIGSTYSGTAGAWAAANYASATGATSVVGTNGATFYITGVQLEIGSTATPFERRLYNQELANCQRYYQQYGKDSSNPYAPVSQLGMANSATDIKTIIMFPVVMRTAPSLTQSTLQLADTVNSYAVTAISQSGNEQSASFCNVDFTVASGLTQYRTYWARCANSTSGFLGISAEL
jgi:hypothetical protein